MDVQYYTWQLRDAMHEPDTAPECFVIRRSLSCRRPTSSLPTGFPPSATSAETTTTTTITSSQNESKATFKSSSVSSTSHPSFQATSISITSCSDLSITNLLLPTFSTTTESSESITRTTATQSSATSDTTSSTFRSTSSPKSTPTLAPKADAASRTQMLAKLGGVISAISILVIALLFLWRRKRRRQGREMHSEPLDLARSLQPGTPIPTGTLTLPQPATNDSSQNLLSGSITANNSREDFSRPSSVLLELRMQNELLRWEIEELQVMLGTPAPPYSPEA